MGTLDARFLRRVWEGRAGRCHMPILAAVEAKSFLGTLLSFFWGQPFWEIDHIDVHSVEVFSHSGGRGESLESLGSPSTLLGNLLCTIPLVLEVSHLDVPFIDFFRDSVKGHDSFHEWGRNSSSKEANENIVICDASTGDIALEGQDVTLEQRGELPIFLYHSLGRESEDGIPGGVLVFTSCLKHGKEVVPHSQGYCCSRDGFLVEGVYPGQGRSFSHVGQGESGLFCIGVI